MHSIGKTIYRLRKEMNLTQEELASRINVTSQAISKWESGSGLPNLSQIIPLANVFGVSTDVLLGTFETNDANAVQSIIDEVRSNINPPATRASVNQAYRSLKDGLSRYPRNTRLLLCCMETGIALAYPENHIYDKENGVKIYEECTAYAEAIIHYSKSVDEIMRAHMIMVLLHSAYGNFAAAHKHAEGFPWRSDMTVHEMNSIIAHFEKDYTAEEEHIRLDGFLQFRSRMICMIRLAQCYEIQEKYEDAAYVYEKIFEDINILFRDEASVPPIRCTEFGDTYYKLACVYIKLGKTDAALSALEKMVQSDIEYITAGGKIPEMKTPILCGLDMFFDYANIVNRKNLHKKLNTRDLEPLRGTDRFKALIEKANKI